MESFQAHVQDFVGNFGFVIDLTDQRNLFSCVGAVFFLFFSVVIVRARRGGGSLSLKAFVRLVGAPRIWLHRSSILDYKMFVASSILLAFLASLFLVGGTFWADALAPVLTEMFGQPGSVEGDSWLIFVFVMLVQLAVFDATYWAIHVASHKIPWFWEFHKVHHSAEVMTPATEFRQHPVDLVAYPLLLGIATGSSYAVLAHVFGPEAIKGGILGQNLILIAHIMTFHHLRHSHISLPFTGLMGHIFHSPAHHHLHHSSNPEHHDRNFGYLLSIWDWMAGTLVMPVKGQKLVLGIGEEGLSHNSLRAAWIGPFAKVWAMIAKRPSKDAQRSGAVSDLP